MFRAFKWSTCLAAAAIAVSVSAPAHSLSLRDAVFASLQDNPEIQIVLKQKLAEESRIREERAQYYPKVDLTGFVGSQYAKSELTRVTSPSGLDNDESLTPKGATFSLRQMIFDGFETDSRVDRSITTSQAASFRLRAQAEQVALEVTRAYLDVIRASRVAQLARANVKAHLNYYEILRSESPSLYTESNAALARARVGEAQNGLSQSLANLRDTVAVYQRLVGEEPDKLVRPETPLKDLPASLKLAVEKAVVQHPMVLAAEREFATSYHDAESSKAAFYPRLDVELDARRADEVYGVRGENTDLRALLVMRYNLYNGGADQARQRTALFERSRAQSVMEKVRRLVEEETRLAWHALMSEQEKVSVWESIAKSNLTNRNAHIEAFRRGQQPLKTLLDVEKELFDSRIALVNSRFNTLYSTYRVMAATGGLLEGLQVPMPEHFMNLASVSRN